MFDQTNDPDMLFMRMFQNQLALLGGYDIYRTMYHLSVWPVESPPIFESKYKSKMKTKISKKEPKKKKKEQKNREKQNTTNENHFVY